MNLRRYEQLKFELAELLRAVPWRAEQAVRNRELFARLAEDRFNLAVVGRYSRGKSTLMNAMLGMDRLPTGIEPLTSVITSVTYGSDEKVVLHFADTRLFLDIRLDQLEEYVTERGNPGNRRRIAEAEVQLPAELLRRGFRFVDTPGLGSPVMENTRTTEHFLDQADAFVMVTALDGSFGPEEARLLGRVVHSGRRCFLVVNKTDLLAPEALNEGLASLRTQLEASGFDRDIALYPLSARNALAARLGGNLSALAASGLPALEGAVTEFLINGKRRELLLVIADRIGQVLREEPALERPRERLTALREEILSEPACSEIDEEPSAGEVRSCEICDVVERAVFEFVTSYQAVLREDAAERDRLVRAGGLCGSHARQLAALTAPREVCTAFAPVLLAQAALLRGAPPRSVSSWVARGLPGSRGCPACNVEREAREGQVASLADELRREPEAAQARSALCMPHLACLSAAMAGEEPLGAVLRHQARLFERLAETMNRFAVKQDASHRHDMSREEKAASRQGVEALVGRPNADMAAAGADMAPRSGREADDGNRDRAQVSGRLG